MMATRLDVRGQIACGHAHEIGVSEALRVVEDETISGVIRSIGTATGSGRGMILYSG